MKRQNFKNETEVNRTTRTKSHHKKSIAMDTITDKRLNLIELGLLVRLLTNSKSYIINKSKVQTDSGVPENKFLKSWKKLQDLGYIEKHLIQGGVRWVINEIPKNYIQSA